MLATIDSGHFTHGLHSQLVNGMGDLFLKCGPDYLNIVPQFDGFKIKLIKESDCYKIVRKSDFSIMKEEVDYERDSIMIAINEAVKTALRHFKPEVKEAARRLKILLDEYNRPVPVVRQPYDSETASIDNLLKDLDTKYSADVEITGITEWVTELATLNAKFDQLAKSVQEQKAQQPDFRMTEVRKEVDKAWKDIITLIKADIIRYGEEKYTDFIKEWNELIRHYNNIWAQHQGRVKAEKEKKKDNSINN